MYEHKKQKLATRKVYLSRVWKNAIISIIIVSISLLIGILGYKATVPEFSWYDSLLNASMILSGMGPVIDTGIILSNKAKLFASMYALFSGITFLTTFGILMAPVIHRFFHKMHIEDNE